MWLWRITITSDREILRLYHRIRLHSCRECNLRRYQIVINEYLKRCQRESSRRGECGSSRLLRFNKWKWALWSYFWSRPPGAARGDDPILSGRKSYLAAVFPPDEGVAVYRWLDDITSANTRLMVVCCSGGWFTLVPLVIHRSSKWRWTSRASFSFRVSLLCMESPPCGLESF